MTTSTNPYYNRPTKPKSNPDKVIIPAWVLSSFFEDYGVTELELLRDKDPELLKFIMLKDGQRLPTNK